MIRYLVALAQRLSLPRCPECDERYWDLGEHLRFDHADVWPI